MDPELRTHIVVIHDQLALLIKEAASELTIFQHQRVVSMRHNTAKSLELLDRLPEMPDSDRSDYLNHHLRNLLTPVHAYAQYIELEIGGPLTPPQRQALETIQRNVRRACERLRTMQDLFGSAGYRRVSGAA